MYGDRENSESKVIGTQLKLENPEVTFYSDDKGVRITNTRAIFGNKTYVMTNISSLTIGRKAPNWVPVIVIFIFGLTAFLIHLILGLLILVIGFIVLYYTKGEYSVKITSSSGESDAYWNPDKEYIQKIINAMNEAIIKRG